jgi:putative endonuclease
MKGWVYILKCSDGTYYTGSTKNLKRRLIDHNSGNGANYTMDRLPVELVYIEFHSRIDYAFEREKQIQKWSRKKKEALIEGGKKNLKTATKVSNKNSIKRRRGSVPERSVAELRDASSPTNLVSGSR